MTEIVAGDGGNGSGLIGFGGGRGLSFFLMEGEEGLLTTGGEDAGISRGDGAESTVFSKDGAGGGRFGR